MVNLNELKWKRIDDDFEDIEGGFDEGTFYGLEEIDDVDVVKEAGTVKFIPRSHSTASTKKAAKKMKESKSSKTKKPEKTKIKSNSESAEDKKQKQGKPRTAEKKSQLKNGVPKDGETDVEDTEETNPDENSFSALSLAKEDPVYSLGTWPANLNWRIYTGLRNCGFTTPTEIQKQSIPLILAGNDVIGKAATGSGKTLAYSIPLINRYYEHMETQSSPSKEDIDEESQTASESNDDQIEPAQKTDVETTSSTVPRRPEGLIVSPTRELAHQIRDHLQAIIPKEDKSKVITLTGGLSIQKQLRQLSNSPAVVVATPGRLLEILEQMPNQQQHEWQRIPSLVLDEADRLIQSGSFAELESTLKIIGISHKRQVLVYSATFSTELWGNLNSHNRKKRKREEIRDIMQEKLGLNSTASLIDADPDSQVAESVTQALIECPNMEKDLYAYYFLLIYPGKSVVFVNSIDAVKRITPLLKELGITAFGVHSEMIQKQRLRSIERFKETPGATLIATDVAARGLDVPLVDHVVHYHLPRSGDMYVHRSGRTARAGNMGVSVALCSPQEASGPLPNLLKLLGTKPQQIGVDYDVLEKLRERVKLAKKIADTQSMAAKKGKTDSWLSEAAEELGVDIDEDFGKLDGREKLDTFKDGGVAALKGLRSELAQLLAQKLGANRRYLTSGSSNLAHEMLKKSQSAILGKPVKSALEELNAKKRKTNKSIVEKITNDNKPPNSSRVENGKTNNSKPSGKSKKSGEKAAKPQLRKKKKGKKVGLNNVTTL